MYSDVQGITKGYISSNTLRQMVLAYDRLQCNKVHIRKVNFDIMSLQYITNPYHTLYVRIFYKEIKSMIQSIIVKYFKLQS